MKPNVGDEDRLQFKRWNYVSFTDDKFFVGAALVKFSYISDIFLYIVDRETKEQFTYTARMPPGLGVHAAYSSVQGCSTWGTPKPSVSELASPWIELCGTEKDGFRFRANVPVKSERNSTKVFQARMDVTLLNRDFDDFILAYPLNGDHNRLVYVHKLAGVPLSSDSMLKLYGNDEHRFQKGLGGLDWTKGNLNYRTVWRWVSLNARVRMTRSGKTEQEVNLGINLSQDVYDIVDESGKVFSTENSIWVDGKAYPLSVPIEVTVPANPGSDVWTIRSAQNSVGQNLDLQFQPFGTREDHSDFGVIVSDFVQPYGLFKGTIELKDPQTGDKISIKIVEGKAFGVVENHVAYW